MFERVIRTQDGGLSHRVRVPGNQRVGNVLGASLASPTEDRPSQAAPLIRIRLLTSAAQISCTTL
jgi:hypothetical protein